MLRHKVRFMIIGQGISKFHLAVVAVTSLAARLLTARLVVHPDRWTSLTAGAQEQPADMEDEQTSRVVDDNLGLSSRSDILHI